MLAFAVTTTIPGAAVDWSYADVFNAATPADAAIVLGREMGNHFRRPFIDPDGFEQFVWVDLAALVMTADPDEPDYQPPTAGDYAMAGLLGLPVRFRVMVEWRAEVTAEPTSDRMID